MLIKGIRKGGESKIFLCYRRVRELPLSLFASEGAEYSACGVPVDDEANGGGFGG